MNFKRSAYVLILLIILCLVGFLFDLWLFLSGYTTFSEAIWDVNRFSLFPIVLLSIIVGHLATTPRFK